MPKKITEYDLERKEILNKILEILEINENKNYFLLQYIDNNLEKQDLINKLETDIKKYFICSSWSCYRNDSIKRKWLTLIKYILKEFNGTLIGKKKNIKINDTIISHTEYFIFFKN